MKRYLSKPWGARILVSRLVLIGWLAALGLVPQISHAQEVPAIEIVSPSISGSQIISLTNQMRAEAGLSGVTYNAKLARSAQLKAEDMAKYSYFAHENAEGQRLAYWLSVVGYGYKFAGENLAVGFSTAQGAMNGWKKSPTHYANIVKPEYQELGVGVAAGVYKGEAVTFVVQHFGVTKYQTIPVAEKVEVEVKPVFTPAPAEVAKTVAPVAINQPVSMEITMPAAPAFELLGIPVANAATDEVATKTTGRSVGMDIVMSLAALIWAVAGATWFIEKEADWAARQKLANA